MYLSTKIWSSIEQDRLTKNSNLLKKRRKLGTIHLVSCVFLCPDGTASERHPEAAAGAVGGARAGDIY